MDSNTLSFLKSDDIFKAMKLHCLLYCVISSVYGQVKTYKNQARQCVSIQLYSCSTNSLQLSQGALNCIYTVM